MKILITTGIYPPDIGGPATYSKLLFDELPKRGIDVSVLSFGQVRHLPKIIRHIAFFIKIIKISSGVNVIFTQDTVSVGLPSLFASKVLHKKFFVRVPGDYAWEQSVQRYGVKETIDDFQNKKYGIRVEILKFLQRLVVNGAHTVITPSIYFKNLVSKWVKNPEKVNCIYNGIDLTDILNHQEKYQKKTMISAGRLVNWKGFSALILSMNILSDWQLFIAGDGPMKKELEDLINKNSLQNRVHLMGQVKRSDLIKKMQDCDVFVLNTHFESFSFQVVEAMACGIPVVTTNIGNLAEIVDHNQNGILIKPDDINEMVKNIKKISEDIEFRKNIVISAKKKALNFSIQNTIDNLILMLK